MFVCSYKLWGNYFIFSTSLLQYKITLFLVILAL